MTETVPREVRLIDRERRAIANAGIAVAKKLARQARIYASNARRLGRDPVDVANAVFLGDRHTEHATAIDVLTRVMVVSHLQGRRRSIINARAHIGEPIQLDRAEWLEDKEEYLLLLLLMTREELAALYAEYEPIAQRLMEEATVPLVDRIEGGSVREIREAFDDAGFSPDDPFSIQNVFTTAGVRAYEDGRIAGWNIPQVSEALYGFRYSAVLDNRTTVLCRTLDGMIAPQDDPVWITLSPPNHWSCRSVRVEVWASSALREPSVRQTDATPEQIAEFIAEKRRFLSYF
jgi:SPP1 gp7 family putative phage head morphogenesis protein